MAGVATQMTIRDGMTSKLNRIFQAVSRTNRALETTDALSDQVNPGANFDRAASAAGRASGQVDNFNSRQRQSEEGARKVASAWGLVKKAIGSALAAISVQKVIELADSMTSTRARLDIMNDGLQTTDELQSMIMKSANRSRAAYQTTADAVSKMGIMAKDAFSNNDELIKFTELINKQFTIAGTSAAGIDAAMLQLTQAMSSGVLRGEELNSVFEQAPTIIQTIADYLDVPIGKIRDMAADGQITSTIVKNAMLASADEINAKFEAMTFENIMDRCLDRVSSSIDKREGSVVYDAIAPAAAELAIMYIELAYLMDRAFPDIRIWVRTLGKDSGAFCGAWGHITGPPRPNPD